MRILRIPIDLKKVYKELQFYDNDNCIIVMLSTFKDGKEFKRQQLGKIVYRYEELLKALENLQMVYDKPLP